MSDERHHKQLLIVANQPSHNTQHLAQRVLEGASHPDVSGITSTLIQPLDATPEQVLACDGLIIGSTENFGSMAGLIKDFLERIYYPCLENTQGLALGVYVKAGNDGSGAISSIERIVTGLRWVHIQPPLLLQGSYQAHFDDQCHELGMTMAAGLEAGIY